MTSPYYHDHPRRKLRQIVSDETAQLQELVSRSRTIATMDSYRAVDPRAITQTDMDSLAALTASIEEKQHNAT
ncbi:hypothetical protein BD626DRAFT_260918 [Schizophyllum amplum]|uniref:Uncharacterized protein n=1 Tax=Schizophyllum amplum TaxID=97359 RepID=A0A550CG96_9AGAR|nr:hypothetical protein BD626DRAFT_260918 [Auriculariopsis ampla]